MLLLEGFGGQGLTPRVTCTPPRDLYHSGSPCVLRTLEEDEASLDRSHTTFLHSGEAF